MYSCESDVQSLDASLFFLKYYAQTAAIVYILSHLITITISIKGKYRQKITLLYKKKKKRHIVYLMKTFLYIYISVKELYLEQEGEQASA